VWCLGVSFDSDGVECSGVFLYFCLCGKFYIWIVGIERVSAFYSGGESVE